MVFFNRFLDWIEGIIYSGSQVCNWLFTPLEIPSWLKNFGYVFIPQHFFNLIIESFLFTPIELISITGLITFVGIALFKWIIS